MKAQDADVVFLQELNEYTPEQLEKDAAQWGHQHSVLLKREGFPTGLTSRYPIEDVHRYIDGFHHGLLRAQIRGIYFYTIHLHPSDWKVRSEEIDRILADIRELPSNAPVVLAGDFNALNPHDSSYYVRNGLEEFFAHRDSVYNENNLRAGRLDYTVLSTMMENGFSDLEYRMRGAGYTFTGTYPTSIEKPGDHGAGRRLDYVLSNAALVPYVHPRSSQTTPPAISPIIYR